MNKNEIVIGTCSSYTYDGLGVVKDNNFTLFVKNLLVGEKAKLKVLSYKKNYGYAKVEELLEVSNNRIEPICKYSRLCGSCHLNHMNDKEQANFKMRIVEDNVRRIAKLDNKIEPIISSNISNYRNKIQIPIGIKNNEVSMGYYRVNSNDIVDIDNCLNSNKDLNEVYLYFKELIKQLDCANVFRHLLLKIGVETKEIMVVFIVRDDINNQDILVNKLVERFSNIKSIIKNINTRNDNVILGDKEELLYGVNKIYDVLDNIKFSISSKSFYQINPFQTKHLYDTVIEYLKPNKDMNVLDLYCGVGTISLYVARYVNKVTGIEIVSQAIEDAKENANINNIDNVEFICEDASTYADYLISNNIELDAIIVDPPRKGLDDKGINAIVNMKPSKIVYVSCDVSTLCRDLNKFNTLGYKTNIIQPVDMFPNTYHIETVCVLERK